MYKSHKLGEKPDEFALDPWSYAKQIQFPANHPDIKSIEIPRQHRTLRYERGDEDRPLLYTPELLATIHLKDGRCVQKQYGSKLKTSFRCGNNIHTLYAEVKKKMVSEQSTLQK